MDFFGVAGLVVAILGLPAMWIARRASPAANKASSFDEVRNYIEAHQADLRSIAGQDRPLHGNRKVFHYSFDPAGCMTNPYLSIDYHENGSLALRKGQWGHGDVFIGG